MSIFCSSRPHQTIDFLLAPYREASRHLVLAWQGRATRVPQKISSAERPSQTFSLQERTLHILTFAGFALPLINYIPYLLFSESARTKPNPIAQLGTEKKKRAPFAEALALKGITKASPRMMTLTLKVKGRAPLGPSSQKLFSLAQKRVRFAKKLTCVRIFHINDAPSKITEEDTPSKRTTLKRRCFCRCFLC